MAFKCIKFHENGKKCGKMDFFEIFFCFILELINKRAYDYFIPMPFFGFLGIFCVKMC